MKISLSNKKKRLVIIGSIVGALLVLGTVSAIFINNANNDRGNGTETTDSSLGDGAINDNQKKKDLVEENSNTKNEGSDTTNSSSLGDPDKITILTHQESNGTLTVSTKLYGYSDGVCGLKVSNGSKTLSYSAGVIFQPEYSTCAGFSVSVNKIGAGTWTIDLTVTSKGQTVTKQIHVEVT